MELMSPSIGALSQALSKAQKSFPSIPRGRTAKIATQKGSYTYDYADLSDVIAGVRETLVDNGLSYSQPIVSREGGADLVTILMHESGEWIASSLPLHFGKTPQELGSAITYARRYALTAILGIATEEDTDASGVESAPHPQRQSESYSRVVEVQTLMEKAGGSVDDVVAICTELAGEGKKVNDLTDEQYAELKKRLTELSKVATG